MRTIENYKNCKIEIDFQAKNLCLGLDIWVAKLVEAENETILVEVENST